MTEHKIATRDEWMAARLELLDAEKALTRRGDEFARQRQKLPWVKKWQASAVSPHSSVSDTSVPDGDFVALLRLVPDVVVVDALFDSRQQHARLGFEDGDADVVSGKRLHSLER